MATSLAADVLQDDLAVPCPSRRTLADQLCRRIMVDVVAGT